MRASRPTVTGWALAVTGTTVPFCPGPRGRWCCPRPTSRLSESPHSSPPPPSCYCYLLQRRKWSPREGKCLPKVTQLVSSTTRLEPRCPQSWGSLVA